MQSDHFTGNLNSHHNLSAQELLTITFCEGSSDILLILLKRQRNDRQ
ncbi:Uncharacterised protein [Vibrio cholerae]|nr:Uncharacterised protein [Vibrio cholerae]